MAVQYEGSSAEAIAFSIENAVHAGDLAPGAGLPAIRALAGELGVSPATVAAAYRNLRYRGVVETAGRHGTRVRSHSAATPRSALIPAAPDGVRDLSHGGPDRRLLPGLARHLRALDASPVGYDRVPRPDVLELARERLIADGVEVPALTFTSGALDGIERVLGAYLSPGDEVVVEDPGWGNLLDLVAAMGLRPIGVPVDDEGFDPDAFDQAMTRHTRAVVLTVRAQNPFGSALSGTRTERLRATMNNHPELVVIEDDHGAELAEEAVQTLTSTTRAWAYVRSVSKPYGPDLRMATVTGDVDTITRVEGRMRLGAGWVSTVLQRVVASLWEDAGVHGDVQRASASYAARRTGLVAALSARDVEAHGRSGLNVWVPVGDETTVVAHLRDAGWAVAPGAAYRIRADPGIRITVSGLDLADLEPLVDAVADAIRRRPTGLMRR